MIAATGVESAGGIESPFGRERRVSFLIWLGTSALPPEGVPHFGGDRPMGHDLRLRAWAEGRGEEANRH